MSDVKENGPGRGADKRFLSWLASAVGDKLRDAGLSAITMPVTTFLTILFYKPLEALVLAFDVSFFVRNWPLVVLVMLISGFTWYVIWLVVKRGLIFASFLLSILGWGLYASAHYEAFEMAPRWQFVVYCYSLLQVFGVAAFMLYAVVRFIKTRVSEQSA